MMILLGIQFAGVLMKTPYILYVDKGYTYVVIPKPYTVVQVRVRVRVNGVQGQPMTLNRAWR